RPATPLGHGCAISYAPPDPHVPPMSITDRMPMNSEVSATATPPVVITTNRIPKARLRARTLRLRDAGFEGLGQGVAHGRELDAVEDVLEEAADDQPLGVRTREATRHGVEQLVAIDLGERRAVGAAHVVREDLEAGDGVRMGLLGEEQVAILLIGVRLLCVLLHADHAAPDD